MILCYTVAEMHMFLSEVDLSRLGLKSRLASRSRVLKSDSVSRLTTI